MDQNNQNTGDQSIQGDDNSSQQSGQGMQGDQGAQAQGSQTTQGGQATQGDQTVQGDQSTQDQGQLVVDPQTGIPTPPPTGGGQTQQGDAKTDDKKKDELPAISDEEAEKFDMRSFDPTLKPDLTSLSDDSLGKALGTQGKQYDGGQMTAAEQFEDIKNTQIQPHSLQLDSTLFLELLAGSISLMYAEKKAIIDQIPKLSQMQVDELLKILKEEKKKFAALNKKHTEELKKIESKHDNSEEKDKLHQAEVEQRSSDEEAAAELLRKLQG